MLYSCAAVPTHEQLLSADTSSLTKKGEGTCLGSIFAVDKDPSLAAGLSPESISVFDWNIYKESIDGWESDFLRLSRGKDIVLLQEVSLTEEMEAILQQQNLNWSLNNAFFFRGNETGVLLASAIAPIATCGQRTKEPIIGLPKTVLFARYAIRNSEKELLVANVHGINITLGTGTYQKQFDDLVAVLQKHDGPLIVAGDFNNWSDGRIDIVASLVTDFALQKVSFAEELRATFFGEFVDHIFYRGLVPIHSSGYSVESSDHNPISVRFRLAENAIE